MRVKTFIPATLLMLSLVNCKKDSTDSPDTLYGTWELESAQGNFLSPTTYPEGNGNTYTFTKDTYTQNRQYDDTSFARSGAYAIYSGKACDYAPEHTLIKFSADNFIQIFSRTGNKITLSAPIECYMDGGTATYRKIK